jgi:hypothetical protein
VLTAVARLVAARRPRIALRTQLPGAASHRPERSGLARAQQNDFDALALLEHGAADLGGYLSFALLATATALTCTVLLRHGVWRLPALTGLFAPASLPILYILGASYAFMLPFALWELLLSSYVFRAVMPADEVRAQQR